MDILFCSIIPANLGQLSKPGTDLKTAGLDVFKTPIICAIWPSFGWDIWGLRHMIPFFYFHDNWFDWEENYWNLNILCENQLIKQRTNYLDFC